MLNNTKEKWNLQFSKLYMYYLYIKLYINIRSYHRTCAISTHLAEFAAARIADPIPDPSSITLRLTYAQTLSIRKKNESIYFKTNNMIWMI